MTRIRHDVPDTFVCDFCELAHKESYDPPHWLHIEMLGDILVSYAVPHPFRNGKDFCSAQHAALYLIRYADSHEVLGPEVMEMLNR